MKTIKKTAVAKKPLVKKQTGGSSSPQTMKDYVKKYKNSGSVTYGGGETKKSAASDTLYKQGPYRRLLDKDPKKKQQVEDLIRVHDNKFFPNGKLTTDLKNRKEVLDTEKMKKGGSVKKTIVKKKK